ncbi:MAG: hypothetical protein K5798_11080 [Nitrosopumilus sp.]|uniref:hypothetical protein n=1 Tax=Nitrosopumilus sp. TaxID=2024843 RepID=UPI00242A4A1A|nr:hypothetical protein [Nitrosopumilus sp.]MCV0367788.1 hypothetical protein [Nitrosopumilus sp.]
MILLVLVSGISIAYGENTCIADSIVESSPQTNPFEFQTTFEGTDDSQTNAKMQITLQGNIEKKSPSASFSTEKIIINRYLADDNPSVSFIASMSDGSIPIVKQVTPSEFFITEKTASSVANDQITLNLEQNFVKDNQNCIITISDNSGIDTFGKYVGKFSIVGDNFETKTVDVEYKVQWHPGMLVFFTIIGVAISMSSGFALLKAENIQAKCKERKDKIDVFKHINSHIEFFNTQAIRGDKLDGIRAFHQSKLDILQRNLLPETNLIDLENTPKVILDDILKQYHDRFEDWFDYVLDADEPTPELAPFVYDTAPLKPKIKIKNANNNAEVTISSLVKHKKTITAFSTIVATLISIPATLFAVTYFSGIPVVDAIIAGGVGFTVYRFKDIGKMLKGLL